MLLFWLLAATVTGSANLDDNNSDPFLNFSSPAPYIFSSLSGLLQQWSNTFFPNGHTIAACEIPRHTLFYHGRTDAHSPPSPEWLAFDIEMSYAIMGSNKDSRILTYRTTRAAKCLYFDGTSASLMGSGTESQMTFLYGDSDSVPSRPSPGPGPGRPGHGKYPRKPPPGDRSPEQLPLGIGVDFDDEDRWNPLADEYFRARGLCNWIKEKGLGGNGWGYEGIVRMNAGFEMIWCDFNSTSLQLVSNLNVSAPLLDVSDLQNCHSHGKHRRETLRQRLRPGKRTTSSSRLAHTSDEGPHGPGMTDCREPFRDVATYMWFSAASKRYGSNGNVDIANGETRAKINTCGLFSFYNPTLLGQSAERADEERQMLNITVNGRWAGPNLGDDRGVALEQLSKRRRHHRTNHVSKEDGTLMQGEVERSLRIALHAHRCSGILWNEVAHEVVAFYARNLGDMQEMLRLEARYPDSTYSSLRDWLKEVRALTHWFMLPFFEYPPGPYTVKTLHEKFAMHSPSTVDAIQRCQSQYNLEDVDELGESELLLSWAIKDTLKGLCTTTFRVGLAVEKTWLKHYNTEPKDTFNKEGITYNFREISSAWLNEIDELMAWLGWVDQWTSCGSACAADELCYIPMWPVEGLGWGQDAEKYLWQPTCINMTSYPPKSSTAD